MILSEKAVTDFNQLYQLKNTKHMDNGRDIIRYEKAVRPTGTHCLLSPYVFKLFLFLKVRAISFENLSVF